MPPRSQLRHCPVPIAAARWRPSSPLAVGAAIALVIAFPIVSLLPGASADGARSSLSLVTNEAAAPYSFDLADWEVAALVEGSAQRAQAAFTLAALTEAAQRDLVLRYFAAVAEADRWRGQLQVAYARSTSRRDQARIADLERRLHEAERQREQLSATATEIIARQISTHVAAEGIADVPVQPTWRFAFPPLTFTVTPPVFFRFTHLPLLLVVAPRDRITVLDSLFLRPALSIPEMELVEEQIDHHGAASLVVPIGGFAAYPSMVPHSASPPHTLQVVAHEWVHHYLAVRPLGWHYFASYPLRSINETVADLAGSEIGEAVFRRYYAAHATTPPQAATIDRAPALPSPPAFDFGRAMAEIRHHVEALLAVGEVSAAEQYMVERKEWLASKGYHLRKLNTAYLTFFGAYAGAGNSYEPKLRRLRERSSSLADFLRRVAAIASEDEFEALAAD